MDMNAKTPMMNLLSNDELRSVLEWYGLPVNDRTAAQMTLEDLCDANNVDVGDLLMEFSIIQADVDGEGQMTEHDEQYDQDDRDHDWLFI